MNLRVVTPEAKVLGADLHVCEVQLLLRPFAELKVSIQLIITDQISFKY